MKRLDADGPATLTARTLCAELQAKALIVLSIDTGHDAPQPDGLLVTGWDDVARTAIRRDSHILFDAIRFIAEHEWDPEEYGEPHIDDLHR